jgi:hypothetical protein
MSPHAAKINLKDKRNIKVGIVALRMVSKWTDKAALTLEKFEGQQGSQYSHGPQHSHDQSMHLEAARARVEERKVKKQDKMEMIKYWLPIRGKREEKVTALIEEVEVTGKSEVLVKTKDIEQADLNKKGFVSENRDVHDDVNTEAKKIIPVLEVTRSIEDVGVNPKQMTVVMEESAMVLDIYDTEEDVDTEESDVVSESDEEESNSSDESNVEQESDTEDDSDTEDNSDTEIKNEEGEESDVDDEGEEEGEIQVQGKPQVSAKARQDSEK